MFLKCAGASATALSLVPSHVLGAGGQTPPNRKLTLALIGCGTQGLREMIDLLPIPNVQVVAVCDPNKDSDNYVDWSRDGLRSGIANAIGKPDWRAGTRGVPGGRDVAREMVELYYANQRGAEKFKGCAVYADFRELLEKENGLDAVKIMTPDHLHATIAIAAMKKGKAVMVHKPLANRLREARRVIETARQTKVPTHFIPASASDNIRAVAEWIRAGHLGTLREVHNWSNRPVWPQYPVIPQGHAPGAGGIRLGPVAGAVQPTVLIIRITQTPCFVAGMNSAAARWPTWGITASGRCLRSSDWTRRSGWSPPPATCVPSTTT